jgi:hypothetical protein
VPDNAPYGSKEVLDLTGVAVFDDAAIPQEVPAVDDDAMHIAAYFGDTNGNQLYQANDVELLQRVLAQDDSGFAAYQLADPVLIADISGNGALQANDVAALLSVINGVPVPTVPPLPNLSAPPPPGGPDPRLFLPTDLAAQPGQTVTVPVRLEVTDPAGITLGGGTVTLAYDTAVLIPGQVHLGGLLADRGFVLAVNRDTPGLLVLTAASGIGTGRFPLSTTGDLFQVDFTVRADVRAGSWPLNLLAGSGSVFTAMFGADGKALTLAPAPSNSASDLGDGRLTVVGPSTPVSTGSFTPAHRRQMADLEALILSASSEFATAGLTPPLALPAVGAQVQAAGHQDIPNTVQAMSDEGTVDLSFRLGVQKPEPWSEWWDLVWDLNRAMAALPG